MHAYGDDGDENAKAAFHALKELDGSKATVTFFITDAGYHRSKRDSPTAKAEEEFLLARGVDDTDFYAVFDSVSVVHTEYMTHAIAVLKDETNGRSIVRLEVPLTELCSVSRP